MADLKFEGDLDGVNEPQIEFIRSVLEKRGYKNETVLFEIVGKAGDNYAANVKRVIVIKDDKKFKMIAKFAPENEMVRTMGNTAFMFQNEHYMYCEVLPKFIDMLQTAEVPEEDMLRYAACYGTYMESPNEVILLEDIQTSNFQMLDRFKSLDNDTVKLVLKNFAILHSASFALKEQEPEKFEYFRNNLINIWVMMSQSKEMQPLFVSFEADVISILDKDKFRKILKGSLSELGKHFKKNSDIDSKSRFSVIQQGDAWTNNIMFTMEGDKAVKCCMIDYQASKVGSPVGDIHYMIFNCTDYETRSKHYHEWIDYYHSELERSLANFGLKANYVYPRDQLDTEMIRYAKLSLCTAIFLSNVLIREAEDAAKMKKAMKVENGMEVAIEDTKLSHLNEKSIARFKNRVESVINSFIEFGYLPIN